MYIHVYVVKVVQYSLTAAKCLVYTCVVEPLNNRHIGKDQFVRYREVVKVVLFWR